MEPSAEHISLVSRAERYWLESRRPLAALALVAPLLAVYEAGVLLWKVPPNGADAFLKKALEMLGFGQHLVAPLLVVVILLGWHHLSHAPWRLSRTTVPGMAVESIGLGACLWVIALVQLSLVGLNIGKIVANAVSFLGAGIYEELLFRLILLSVLMWAFRQAVARPWLATLLAIIISSLLFAAAHHVGPYGQEFLVRHFLFRFVAGVFFSIVFLYRGFGIAAASHAAYDIFVGPA